MAGLLTGCGATLPESEPTATLAPSDSMAGAVAATGAPEQKAEASRAADTFAAVTTPGNAAYKIGPHDVLDVSVFKVPELSKSVQVAETGTVNLPLVGEVPAAGFTAQEIERDLTRKLGAKYLQNPQVSVYVKEFNSQRMTIEGAVKKPGVYPYRGKSSLLQLIAMAEGLDPNADETVVVFRQIEGKRAAARFDVDAIRSGQADDPPIQSGDLIVAGSSSVKATFNNFMKVLPLASVFALL
jgi:polysaccharide export outer membrane protein